MSMEKSSLTPPPTSPPEIRFFSLKHSGHPSPLTAIIPAELAFKCEAECVMVVENNLEFLVYANWFLVFTRPENYLNLLKKCWKCGDKEAAT